MPYKKTTQQKRTNQKAPLRPRSTAIKGKGLTKTDEIDETAPIVGGLAKPLLGSRRKSDEQKRQKRQPRNPLTGGVSKQQLVQELLTRYDRVTSSGKEFKLKGQGQAQSRGRKRSRGRSVLGIKGIENKLIVSADFSTLRELSGWIDSILNTVTNTSFQASLVAKAFRPTFLKALTYTPFDPHQDHRKHLLESVEVDFGSRGKGTYLDLTWGDSGVPHAKYVYGAPESYRFQGEGRPRWLEKAIFENEAQFLKVLEELMYATVVLEKRFKTASLVPSAAEMDKLLEVHFYSATQAALEGEQAFRQYSEAFGGTTRGTAEEFLQDFEQFGTALEYD